MRTELNKIKYNIKIEKRTPIVGSQESMKRICTSAEIDKEKKRDGASGVIGSAGQHYRHSYPTVTQKELGFLCPTKGSRPPEKWS